MTIEQMHGIAKERMDKQISCLSADVITFDEALATLSAFKSVNLFSDDEYLEYCLRLRRFARENL